ncbi:MAG: tetratricopeptide repeat protein [Spirochaetia bacterium]|nr:tetratricopeptide repeat protein [Spirochaetia bacterium]
MITPEMQNVLNFYNEGLALYKQRKWNEALAKFKKAIEVKADDGPSKLYIQRCEHFIETPPAADWDGVFTMTTK